MQRCHTYKIAVSKYIYREHWVSGWGDRVGGGGGGGVRVDVNREVTFL